MPLIKDIRDGTGMSKKAFANYFNIPQATITDWESGRRTPPQYIPQMMIKIIKNDDLIPIYYVSGIYALNIPCSLETCGDWHSSSLAWDKCRLVKASKVYGSYGIEYYKYVPEIKHYVNTANHIRACLDLIAAGNFAAVQGMNKDFICTNKYNKEIFDHVTMLKNNRNWNKINIFMEKEYRMEWISYKENDADGF